MGLGFRVRVRARVRVRITVRARVRVRVYHTSADALMPSVQGSYRFSRKG